MGDREQGLPHEELEGDHEEMKTPTITSVKALSGFRLSVSWTNGERSEVDLSGPIREDPALFRLRSGKVFLSAKVGLWGHSVAWGKEIDIGADTLWTLAHEQAGLAMPTDDFNAWLDRNGLSLAKAGESLGLSRRMVIYYHMGHRPIPKIVALACRGYEALQKDNKRRKAA